MSGHNCDLCKKPLLEGDLIASNGQGSVVHAECAPGGIPAHVMDNYVLAATDDDVPEPIRKTLLTNKTVAAEIERRKSLKKPLN